MIHWPAGIKAKGEVRQQYHHITDIAATILDVTKTPFLKELDGEEQMDLDGVSMAYSFDNPNAPTRHPEQRPGMVAGKFHKPPGGPYEQARSSILPGSCCARRNVFQ